MKLNDVCLFVSTILHSKYITLFSKTMRKLMMNEGHPTVLLTLENLRAKYNTKYFLLDRYLGYLYAAGGETISSDPIA